MINAEEVQETGERELYRELRKKVLSCVMEIGMEDEFQYDPEPDEYFEMAAYEARAPHLRYNRVKKKKSRRRGCAATCSSSAPSCCAEKPGVRTHSALLEAARLAHPSIRAWRRRCGPAAQRDAGDQFPESRERGRGCQCSSPLAHARTPPPC